MLTTALEDAGYQTVELRDLRRTLEVVANQQPVAAVVDLDNFGVDDYRFVLRALRSVGLSTPVLSYPCEEFSAPGAPDAVPATARTRLQSVSAGVRKRSA